MKTGCIVGQNIEYMRREFRRRSPHTLGCRIVVIIVAIHPGRATIFDTALQTR